MRRPGQRKGRRGRDALGQTAPRAAATHATPEPPPSSPEGPSAPPKQTLPSPFCIPPPSQVKRIEAAGGRVLGGRLVTGFEADPNTGAVAAVTARDVVTGAEEAFQADAVVSAIGITGGGLFWRLFGGWSGGLFGGGLGGLAF